MPTDNALVAPNSSLGLQLLLITSAIFCPCWFLLTLALLIYKATFLPYPPTALGFEITCTFLVWFVQIGAVQQGKKGNLTENIPTLAVGMLLLLLVCGGAIFYMWGQTYVMMLDLGFSASLLALDGLAVLICGATMYGISSAGTHQINGPRPIGGVHQKSE